MRKPYESYYTFRHDHPLRPPQCGQVHPDSTPLWGKRSPLSPVSPRPPGTASAALSPGGSASMSFWTPRAFTRPGTGWGNTWWAWSGPAWPTWTRCCWWWSPVANVGEPEMELIQRIKALKLPAVLVINKVDTLENKEKLLEVIAAYTAVHQFDAVMPISAREKDGVEELLELLEQIFARGAPAFPGRYDHRPARTAGDGGNPAGEAAATAWTRRSPTAPPWRSPGSPSGTARSSTWRPPSSARRPATRASSSAREAPC